MDRCRTWDCGGCSDGVAGLDQGFSLSDHVQCKYRRGGERDGVLTSQYQHNSSECATDFDPTRTGAFNTESRAPGKWDECPRLSGNEGSFLVSPVKKTFPVISLRGKQMRMVIRRETIRLAPHTSRTPTSWLCEWTKNATQPLYATALVVCGLDHISGPGVRFRDRAYGYTQRRPYKISTFWEDPAAAIYRNDGDPYAPVTAHFGRAIVFPVELQYRIDSLKLIDPARAGALTLLVVGMVDDPTVDLGPDRPLVPSFKTESPEFYQCASRIVGLSVSSYESERWEHYKTHLEPA